MDIEQLTKAQIVLLVLLVSFVTSIATGIVTVSLLAQAPPTVTQTINRVVERTVERVVPDEEGNEGAVETVREVTVVVKEEDLITDSIAKNTLSMVRIARPGAATSTPLGIGIVATESGTVIVDRSIVSVGERYLATMHDGIIFEARISEDAPAEEATTWLALQRDADSEYEFVPAAFPESVELKLGQTVLSLGGLERTNVQTGIVSDLVYAEAESPNSLSRVETNTESAIPGNLLVNIFGEVIGMSTGSSRAVNPFSYTPLRKI